MGKPLSIWRRIPLLSLLLFILAAVIFVAGLSNRPLPYLDSERRILVALAVVGLLMDTVGGLPPKIDRARFSWLDPFTIVGSALGLIILYVVFSVWTYRPIFLIETNREALIFLGAVMVVKIVMSRIHDQLLGRI